MAKKKKTVKRTRKAAAPKRILINLTAAQLRKAEECVRSSGKIRISMKEILKTKLPKRLTSSEVIID